MSTKCIENIFVREKYSFTHYCVNYLLLKNGLLALGNTHLRHITKARRARASAVLTRPALLASRCNLALGLEALVRSVVAKTLTRHAELVLAVCQLVASAVALGALDRTVARDVAHHVTHETLRGAPSLDVARAVALLALDVYLALVGIVVALPALGAAVVTPRWLPGRLRACRTLDAVARQVASATLVAQNALHARVVLAQTGATLWRLRLLVALRDDVRSTATEARHLRCLSATTTLDLLKAPSTNRVLRVAPLAVVDVTSDTLVRRVTHDATLCALNARHVAERE